MKSVSPRSTVSPRRTAFRITGSLVLLASAVLGLQALAIGYDLEREIWFLRATGYIGLAALFLSLSITPIHRLASRLQSRRLPPAHWLAFRRTFGITAALAGLAHGTLAFTTYLDWNWQTLGATPYLRAGLVTLAILTALLLTSFPSLLKLFRVRLWQHLHRLAYIAALFLLQHLLLAPFAPRKLTLVLFAGLLLVAALRFLPLPKKQ